MLPTRLMPLEHGVLFYHYVVPHGTSLEDLSNPGYWAHVAHQLKTGTRIVCDAVDNSWTATLIVRSVAKVEAHTEVLTHNELGKSSKSVSDTKNSTYFVEFRGPKLKWCVVTKNDGVTRVLKDSFETREIAAEWLVENTAPPKKQTVAKKSA